MLRSVIVIVGVATCAPRASVEPRRVPDGHSAVQAAPSSSLWSEAVGARASGVSVGRWLATRVGKGDAVLVLLGDGAVQFVDPHGRRLTEVPAPGLDAGALDAGRGIVWLGGGRRIAAIDLLADEARVAVIAEDLPHEGYAVQLASAPVIAPEVLVGVDAADEPESAYMLLDWSQAEASVAEVVVGEDGVAALGRTVGRWDARWLDARAERVGWPAMRSQGPGRHPECPRPHGDLDCQPFGDGGLWLVAVGEETGDVVHVDAVLFDARSERWAVPRDGVAPAGLRWGESEPQGVEFAVTFDRGGRAYTTTTHVCEVDGGCRALDGEVLGFLSGGVGVGTES